MVQDFGEKWIIETWVLLQGVVDAECPNMIEKLVITRFKQQERRTAARESFKIRMAELDNQHEIRTTKSLVKEGCPLENPDGPHTNTPSLLVLYSSTTWPYTLSNQVDERHWRASRKATQGVLENKNQEVVVKKEGRRNRKETVVQKLGQPKEERETL
ncbi:hypothetical protein M9H77_02312 [Catharanthus roseus]|uniref:Uncharacterized protein n=1 Tax=Catharanthus roseus TaxID=4058 RepID=A0ACC0C873_CATRO|nr:hypothetical protein M9H77_02312 [Catharanthus roseus]